MFCWVSCFVLQLVFLKLTALIFSASDFRHPVTTPAAHFLLEAILCPVNSLEVVLIGLGLCTVAYEVDFIHLLLYEFLPIITLLLARSLSVYLKGTYPKWFITCTD